MMIVLTPRIDIHAHYMPPAYRKLLGSRGIDRSDGVLLPQWDISIQLESMEKLNIRFAALTISSPHPHFGDGKESIECVRASNEEGLAISKKYPDKLGLIATLPLPEVDASLAEIDFAVERGVLGFVMPTHARGIYLGDEKFEPVFELLNKHKALLCVHPTTPSATPPNVLDKLPYATMEFMFDTARAVVNMIINGVIDRYPDIKFVIPHAGAVLLVLADRINNSISSFNADSKPDLYSNLRSLYYDIAGKSISYPLDILLKIIGIDHILYGSDRPFMPVTTVVGLAEELDHTDKITDADRTLIYYENAKKLLSL